MSQPAQAVVTAPVVVEQTESQKPAEGAVYAGWWFTPGTCLAIFLALAALAVALTALLLDNDANLIARTTGARGADGPQGPPGTPGGALAVAQFVHFAQSPNGSVAPTVAFTVDQTVVNTTGSNITAAAGHGGTEWTLADAGTYRVDTEMSLGSAGSIAVYITAPVASLLAPSITGSSTATTWIHGTAVFTTTAPTSFIVSPVTGTASVVTAGTAASDYVIRVTITRLL